MVPQDAEALFMRKDLFIIIEEFIFIRLPVTFLQYVQAFAYFLILVLFSHPNPDTCKAPS